MMGYNIEFIPTYLKYKYIFHSFRFQVGSLIPASMAVLHPQDSMIQTISTTGSRFRAVFWTMDTDQTFIEQCGSLALKRVFFQMFHSTIKKRIRDTDFGAVRCQVTLYHAFDPDLVKKGSSDLVKKKYCYLKCHIGIVGGHDIPHQRHSTVLKIKLQKQKLGSVCPPPPPGLAEKNT